MATKLYYHKTGGGAEYLCDSPIKGTDEGDLFTAVVRLDAGYISLSPVYNAAPELLEALVMCSEYFAAIDEMQPKRNHGTKGEAVRKSVRAAIAKATP